MGKELKWIEPKKLLIDTPNPRAYITNLTAGAPQGAKSTGSRKHVEYIVNQFISMTLTQEEYDYIMKNLLLRVRDHAPTRTTEEVREAPEDNERRSSS